MSNQQVDSLIRMINQIAANNAHHDTEEQAAEAVAGHLNKFWALSMRKDLVSYAQKGGADLSPLSRMAAARLRV